MNANTATRHRYTYLSVQSGRHVALLAEPDESHFDGQRQVRFGTVLRTDHGYVGQARRGSQTALFGCVGVCTGTNTHRLQ